jgi:hypothetical protein
MEEVIHTRYLNRELNIALTDWRQVYLIASELKQLLPEEYKGKLVYRARGSSKRISYERIKKGLVKKTSRFLLHLPF